MFVNYLCDDGVKNLDHCQQHQGGCLHHSALLLQCSNETAEESRREPWYSWEEIDAAAAASAEAAAMNGKPDCSSVNVSSDGNVRSSEFKCESYHWFICEV